MKANRYEVEQIGLLPDQPGIYKFFNKHSILIYVGKAKSLKKRVASYFNKGAFINRKTQRLVSEIARIEYTVSLSEFDALLLENNLIKQHQPKYNIQLKDDKSFPYICVLNERFPRIISTRRFKPSQGQYFGPYSSVVAMNNVLDLIRSLYTIRTCKYDLSEDNILASKFKVCLEYHIGNCQGPCEGLQNELDYNKDIELAKDILKGNLSKVVRHFEENMMSHSENLDFEKAQIFKDKLQLLKKFQSKTLVVNQNIADAEVFSITSDQTGAYVSFMRIRNGAINMTNTLYVKKKLNEMDEEVLNLMVLELREKYKSDSDEILTNIPLSVLPDGVRNVVPVRGDKKKLVDLSLRNAMEYRKEKIKANQKNKVPIQDVLFQLQDDLRLPLVPLHIECFDNSNLHGSNPVASMVCFKNGRPAKKDYRHYNIKSVKGIDDFASMKEVVGRRYSRLQKEGLEFPNLIIVDGGKGQLSSACEALKEIGLYGKIPIIGVAKKLEELYFPEDTIPLHINRASPSLRLIQQLRNEAHRFAIQFHRNQRSKSTIKTSLTEIDGIGPNTSDKLLKQFRSIKKIKESSLEQISAVIGEAKAKLVVTYLHKKREQKLPS